MEAVPGGAGGAGLGAGVYNSSHAMIESSLFVNNAAVGGIGGSGKFGWVAGDMAFPGGNGGAGGNGDGGAIFNVGTISLVNCTLTSNSGIGGDGGAGGGPGFWRYYGVLYHGSGGIGGTGGSGLGGIGSSNAAISCVNCTVAYNSGTAGTNGPSSLYWLPGSGVSPYLPWIPPGIAAGGIGSSGALAVNCLFAFNTPSNFCGSLTDSGYNLSSDASIAFTGTGSRTNTEPILGPLSNNGGPTLTMALLPGSPAIDTGSIAAAPATDQRGIARPQGPGADIGAFEFQYIPAFFGAAIQNGTNFQMQIGGFLPNEIFTIQTSTNLVTWLTVTNCVFGTNGVFQFIDPVCTNSRTRFYRFSVP